MRSDRTGYQHKELAPLGDLLAGVFARQQWKNQWRLFLLVRAWPSIVGTEVGRLTAPAFFREQTLWIYVQDSAWMHHLQFIKLDLLARINHVLNDQPIADIRWQLQPHQPPTVERDRPQPRAIDDIQDQGFQRMTEGISNQQCREALQRLWRSFAAYDK